MTALGNLKKHLRPGSVYRRSDLEKWSNAIDRHLKLLVKQNILKKLAEGLYYCPKKTEFGELPAEDKALVKAFLKDHRFLLTTPNAYNALGVGTTQLYNETVVYNHKRHGRYKLGGRVFNFKMKPHFPLKLSPEFLLVDLVNNSNKIAENREQILKNVVRKASLLPAPLISRLVHQYGGLRAKKVFAPLLKESYV